MLNLFLAFLLGVIVTVLIVLFVRKVSRRKVFYRLALMKNYWKLVGVFVILVALLFYFVYIFYGKEENFYPILNIVAQLTPWIFAMCIGYYGYIELVENRFNNLQDRGDKALINKLYLRAINYLEEAHKIKPKDFQALANLLEMYLLLKDFEKFDLKIKSLEKIILEKTERAILFYLKILRFTLVEDLGKTRGLIKELVDFVREGDVVLTPSHWGFGDLQGSDVYLKELKTTGRGNILDNVVKYLNRSLSPDDRGQFESSNYELTAAR